VSPEILPDNIIALRALVLAAWAERDAERSEKARLIEERDQLAGQNDRLRHLIRQLQRMQFGRRSEKLDPDQFNLALEDLEQAVAARITSHPNSPKSGIDCYRYYGITTDAPALM
jgi:transposase